VDLVESIGFSSSRIHYIQHGAEHIKEKGGHNWDMCNSAWVSLFSCYLSSGDIRWLRWLRGCKGVEG